jgi:hypothetical protein
MWRSSEFDFYTLSGVKVRVDTRTKRYLEIVIPPGESGNPEVVEALRLLKQRIIDGFSPAGVVVSIREVGSA